MSSNKIIVVKESANSLTVGLPITQETLESVTSRGNTTANGISVGSIVAPTASGTSLNFTNATVSGLNASGITANNVSGTSISTVSATITSVAASSVVASSVTSTNDFYKNFARGNHMALRRDMDAHARIGCCARRNTYRGLPSLACKA